MATPFDYLNALAALEKPAGVIAFPTDTVYGLGCLPQNVQAIEKIYRMKGRASQKPLILMGHSSECFAPFLGEMSLQQANRFHELADRHWPGALTIVVPKSDRVPDAMTQGFDTVGLRVPDCPSLIALLEMVPGGVLATTSANLSNQPESLRAAEVYEAFGNQLDFILMSENAGSGLPSTVAAIEPDGRIIILRPGRIVLD